MTVASFASETMLPDLPLLYRGKVRDIYDAGDDRLLIVASDRISAFDCILPTAIRSKGAVLTQLSAFWFRRLGGIIENHLITANIDEMPENICSNEYLRHRSMLVRKTAVFPVECIVRGYLEGSGWKEYQKYGSVCGIALPSGLTQCSRLPKPLFTPATKAASGHDENITFAEFENIIGAEAAQKLADASLRIYAAASEYALSRGIIIADTKFEFGTSADGRILLIDEILTPDSSRFWTAEDYSPGRPQVSFDKQFVREYLETLVWDKQPPAPPLPAEIAEATSAKYLEAYKLLTGEELQITD